MLRNRIDSFLSEKLTIQESLQEALMKFPSNIVFKEYNEEFQKLFEKHEKVIQQQENNQADITIEEETQEFLMSESLVLEQPQQKNQQIVPFTATQLTDSGFWEDPETHGEVDLVFKQVDEIEKEKEKEEMQREKKEKMEMEKKEEMERQKKKEEIEKKEKEDKERQKNEKEEKQKEETINVSKIAYSYLDDAPSFSLGFTPEEEKEENEEKDEKEDKGKKPMKEDKELGKRELKVSESLRSPYCD